MNDDQIDDLKQFILTAVAQQTTEIRGDIQELKGDVQELKSGVQELKSDVKRLDQKIDDLPASVASAIDTSNEETENRLKDHELRITNLETKTA